MQVLNNGIQIVITCDYDEAATISEAMDRGAYKPEVFDLIAKLRNPEQAITWIDGGAEKDKGIAPETDEGIAELLAEHERLQDDDRQHLTGEIEADYCDELAVVQFALLRKYFECKGVSEIALDRVVMDVDWSDREMFAIFAELATEFATEPA